MRLPARMPDGREPWRVIRDGVLTAHDMTLDEFEEDRRMVKVVRCRQQVAFLLNVMLGLSPHRMEPLLRRDHATIGNLLKRYRASTTPDDRLKLISRGLAWLCFGSTPVVDNDFLVREPRLPVDYVNTYGPEVIGQARLQLQRMYDRGWRITRIAEIFGLSNRAVYHFLGDERKPFAVPHARRIAARITKRKGFPMRFVATMHANDGLRVEFFETASAAKAAEGQVEQMHAAGMVRAYLFGDVPAEGQAATHARWGEKPKPVIRGSEAAHYFIPDPEDPDAFAFTLCDGNSTLSWRQVGDHVSLPECPACRRALNDAMRNGEHDAPRSTTAAE